MQAARQLQVCQEVASYRLQSRKAGKDYAKNGRVSLVVVLASEPREPLLFLAKLAKISPISGNCCLKLSWPAAIAAAPYLRSAYS
jgi:hypothetical protein